MNRIKIKKWIKEHKKGLIIISVSAVTGVMIHKRIIRNREKFHECAMNIVKKQWPAINGSTGCICSDINNDNMTLKDCSKLINELEECSFYNPDDKITGMTIYTK